MYAPHIVSQTTDIDHIKILNTYTIKRIVGLKCLNSINNVNINNLKHYKCSSK